MKLGFFSVKEQWVYLQIFAIGDSPGYSVVSNSKHWLLTMNYNFFWAQIKVWLLYYESEVLSSVSFGNIHHSKFMWTKCLEFFPCLSWIKCLMNRYKLVVTSYPLLLHLISGWDLCHWASLCFYCIWIQRVTGKC